MDGISIYDDIEGAGKPMSKKRRHHIHQNKEAKKILQEMADEESKFQNVFCTRCHEYRKIRLEKKQIIL